MLCTRALSRSLGRPRLVQDERGFTLIEAMLAMLIFAIVATGLAGMLSSGIKAHGLARQRTQAKELARAQIENVRRYTYDGVGFVGGNPAGQVPASEASKQVDITAGTGAAATATMTTQIQYVNDPTPTSYATAANYKRVTVSIVRNRDSKELIRSVTYIAPAVRAPLGGINNAIINATVTDFANATPFPSATVSLGAGPSAPRSDVTNATGLVTFPALTPTSGSGYYDVTTSVSGYATVPEDAPPSATARFALVASQTKNTSIRIYKTGTTLYVSIPGWTSGGTTTVYVGSSRKAQSFTYTGGTLTITSLNGEPLLPGLAYAVGAYKVVTSPSTARYYTPSTTATVPDDYPTAMTSTFSPSLGAAVTTRTITVQVRKSSVAVVGARVDVQGGPSPGYYLTGVTDSSGNITLNVPQSTNGTASTYYTVTAWNATATGTGQALNVNASSNVTTTVAVP